MDFDISNEARTKTLKCPSDFLCLAGVEPVMCGPGREMCTVAGVASGEALWVMPADDTDCAYRGSVGDSAHMCICPTRREIYDKYAK